MVRAIRRLGISLSRESDSCIAGEIFFVEFSGRVQVQPWSFLLLPGRIGFSIALGAAIANPDAGRFRSSFPSRISAGVWFSNVVTGRNLLGRTGQGDGAQMPTC